MEITYTKQGDYLLPNLTLKETKKGNINKYGRMRLKFLKERYNGFKEYPLYVKLIGSGTEKELIKDVEPSIESHNLYREFTYKTKIKDLETKVLIQTTKDNISKIMIENTYMGYIINYNGVNVDKK